MEILENMYYENFTVPSYMTDYNRRLTPSFLFNLMQDAAVNQSERSRIGWNDLHPKGMFWALSKMDIEWQSHPLWGDRIRIVTWPKEHRFLIQPRDFIIENGKGEPLIRVTTHWVILGADGKPRLLSDFENRLIACPLHAIERQPTRLRKAQDNGQPVVRHPVVYTDIDMNGHANNSAYVTWTMNSFAPDFHKTHELTFLAINYIAQTMPTDHYALVKQETAPLDFIISVVTEQGTEVCRLETRWKTL